jgi:hypothetical protein
MFRATPVPGAASTGRATVSGNENPGGGYASLTPGPLLCRTVGGAGECSTSEQKDGVKAAYFKSRELSA